MPKKILKHRAIEYSQRTSNKWHWLGHTSTVQRLLIHAYEAGWRAAKKEANAKEKEKV